MVFVVSVCLCGQARVAFKEVCLCIFTPTQTVAQSQAYTKLSTGIDDLTTHNPCCVSFTGSSLTY